jgi:NTP pyrophosphatase (non-canonical NTP hydrolase)
MQTIRDWQTEVHRLAREKGWHPPEIDPRDPNRALALLMLITTELAEAAEDIRDGYWTPAKECDTGKPVGVPSEIADAAIRILDACEAWGIDLQAAIEEKHAYNMTRPHRHGGKLV